MRAHWLATILLASALSTPSVAADAIEMKAVTKVAKEEGPPHVIFQSNVDGRLEVSISCSGLRFSMQESISPGGSYTLAMSNLPTGPHRCTGNVILRTADGGEGTMPLELDVAVLVPPRLKVAEEDLDLEARTAVLQSDRPLADVKIDVFGVGGASIGGGRQPGTGLTRLPLSWTSEGEIVRIDVRGTDADGAFAVLTLLPWSYQIPHTDVIFESNQAVVRASQEPLLEEAWGHVEETLAKYGEVVPIELFVAGYTDTVGPVEHNQALSSRRARAIAEWFRARGFDRPIHYQGFGESVLAELTPDGTDEPANRRALYVMAAQRPPVSTDLPRRHWTRLP